MELKPISKDAIGAAIQKAERYRFLNQPWAAESICLDVLRVEPENQHALVVLLLALSDQFACAPPGAVEEAREAVARLHDDYKRAYYAGIISERRAKAQLDSGTPGAGQIAYDLLRDAMTWYERAEAIRPAGNDEAILRWNTCARILAKNPHLAPRAAESFEPAFEE